MRSFDKQTVQSLWIGMAPPCKKEVALVIPQFNERSNKNFLTRLIYYKKMTEEFGELMDVIIVDDGSTDGSLEEIRFFKEGNGNPFFLLSVSPNMNKVGAIYAVISSIDHEFVILSDFDTDFKGLQAFFGHLTSMKADQRLMGVYFRMVPFEGRGSVFLFQQLEYSMSRACYKFYKRENSVPVMPGAGCCYKRDILLKIYEAHSGLRSGEDREATLLGLKLGYKASYVDNVISLTRPPLSFQFLLKQRVRWNLGYVETVNKERDFYYRQIRKFSFLGIRTLADIIRVQLMLLFPFIVLTGVFAGWHLFMMLLLVIYFTSVIWPLNAVLISPEESVEFRKKRIQSILFYPFYKIALECITWWIALFVFTRNLRRNFYTNRNF